ncbi:MAG: heme o synthase [Terrimicrobiaceae bacterium]|nr:heme o synthase [Terrimicrobiaceae bacterium]
MKSAATTTTAAEPRSLLADLAELVKARLSMLVLATTLVGYLLGQGSAAISWIALTATLVGTALSAGGAAALNQWWERDTDALMRRTRTRPLPAGRMHPGDALLFGVFFSGFGVACLALVNSLSASLAAATIVIYVLVYTPLKRISAINTLVGAIPGALPPLIGWIAATGDASLPGWVLFAILWFWQMPHFLAIAWMYRDEYAGAGFIFLTGRDPDGRATARQMILYSLCLVVVSVGPAFIGLNSMFYFFGALLLGAAFCGLALHFGRHRTREAARSLFFASIIYLPLLLALLVATRRA